MTRVTRSFAILLAIVLLAQTVLAAQYRIHNRYYNAYAKATKGAKADEYPVVTNNNPVGLDYSWDIILLKYRNDEEDWSWGKSGGDGDDDDEGDVDRLRYEIKHLRTRFAAAATVDKDGSRVVAVPEGLSSTWRLSPRFNDHNPSHSFVIYLGDTNLVWTHENGVVRLRSFENIPGQHWEIKRVQTPSLNEWLHRQ